MDQNHSNPGERYHIRLKGALDYLFADWPDGIIILSAKNGETLLSARFTDQSALRGFLDQLWNLNFTILSFRQIRKRNHQNSGLPNRRKVKK